MYAVQYDNFTNGMENIMNEQQTSTSAAPSRITIDDVRAAIGDTSPHHTNGHKIRAVIGRGSMETIQKFLNVLRDEDTALSQPTTATDVPPMPSVEMAAVWAMAWTTAQSRTAARLERLSAERDALTVKNSDLAADLAETIQQFDLLETQVQVTAAALLAAQGQVTAAEDATAKQLADAAAHTETQAKVLARAQDEIARVTEAAAHAAQLSTLTAQVERLALQSTIDRMTDQLGEMKAMRIVGQTLAENRNPAYRSAESSKEQK
jgi:hypothetical protein